MVETLLTVLAGASGAALIKLIDGVIQWKLKQKENQQNQAQINSEKDHDDIQVLKDGLMAIMLDRIQYLCKSYISDGEIDFDDRKRLHIMWDVYHGLGGNGDLNILMGTVDNLPLKNL